MVLEAVPCKHCGQTQEVKRYGTARASIQRYHCYDCGRTFVQTYTHKACDPFAKEQITQMVLNGSGIRDTARVLGVNRNPVSNQFKKKY
jgi:transposase-like protein